VTANRKVYIVKNLVIIMKSKYIAGQDVARVERGEHKRSLRRMLMTGAAVAVLAGASVVGAQHMTSDANCSVDARDIALAETYKANHSDVYEDISAKDIAYSAKCGCESVEGMRKVGLPF
jgi:hypothetical protein